MTNKRPSKERNVEQVTRDRGPIPWRYGLLSLICAVIMTAGFFFAAKQHFSSVDYSMKNSDMRKAKEKLKADQRKLEVEREEVSAPATIEKAGLKIGLQKYTSAAFQFIDAAKNISPDENARAGTDGKNKTSDKAVAAKDAKAVTNKPAEPGKKEQSARSAKTETGKTAAREMAKTLMAKK